MQQKKTKNRFICEELIIQSGHDISINTNVVWYEMNDICYDR